ncbi:PREDICTED: proteoglycan 4-like [Nelumbo nucifera]|uniref:SHSP domain-containing protein n=2 Tax=Nelumbo nucifera TaxID=4432 RepID=A0A822Y990_NELNU|nr:PREDICTED: proteoglycan 4-like [Nelumbo nucifera]DAD29100.1 TPA_asm: hypothetical protein HUJ06_030568 [Nelumbo nucifera]
MNRRSQTSAPRVYQDFQPLIESKEVDKSKQYDVYLPGFTKDQLKVELDGHGNLKITGERQLGDNKWSRFSKELRLPENCIASGINAKFDSLKLSIIIPKTTLTPAKPQEQIKPTPEEQPSHKSTVEPEPRKQPKPTSPEESLSHKPAVEPEPRKQPKPTPQEEPSSHKPAAEPELRIRPRPSAPQESVASTYKPAKEPQPKKQPKPTSQEEPREQPKPTPQEPSSHKPAAEPVLRIKPRRSLPESSTSTTEPAKEPEHKTLPKPTSQEEQSSHKPVTEPEPKKQPKPSPPESPRIAYKPAEEPGLDKHKGHIHEEAATAAKADDHKRLKENGKTSEKEGGSGPSSDNRKVAHEARAPKAEKVTGSGGGGGAAAESGRHQPLMGVEEHRHMIANLVAALLVLLAFVVYVIYTLGSA